MKARKFSPSNCPKRNSSPPAGQGAVGIECLKSNTAAKEALATINHEPTFIRTRAERAFLARLQAGCQTPVGAWTWFEKDDTLLCMSVRVFDEDDPGAEPKCAEVKGDRNDPEKVGELAFQEVKKMSDRKQGICYLVGAGPGDPGLMTLRGKECIEIADVILYDHLSNPEFLQWAKPDAELVYAGKKATEHAIPQEELNEKLIARVREGKIVTRLKGGDPFVFGRGGEEADKLREAGLAFEFVSGISSAIAGPAYAGIPVTHRDHCSQLTIFTGHENPGKEGGSSVDYEQLARAPGTKVMLMGVQSLRDICEAMIGHGADKDEAVAIIHWASTGRQRTVTGTVSTIADVAERSGIKPPAVAVFGSVVGCRDALNWFEVLPMRGVRVAVTRAQKQAGKTQRGTSRIGCRCVGDPHDPNRAQ